MCFIFVKKSDQHLDSDLVIGARHLGNRDGAGCMYVENDRVVIEKILPRNGHDGDDEVRELFLKHSHRTLAFHVRNQSLGPVNLDNSHPYWVTNKDMGHPHDIAMMHNGTIPGVQINTDLSDTGNIATYILRPLFAKKPSLFNCSEYWFQLSCFIGGNKFVLMRDDGQVMIVNPGAGRILEGSGVWVSGKVPLRPVSPDRKTSTSVSLVPVTSTPASKSEPLRPADATWETETDGKFHLRAEPEEDIDDLEAIMRRIDRESRGMTHA